MAATLSRQCLTIDACIDALIETKRRHTTEKQKAYHSLDTDDHGSVLMPEPADPFEVISNHPSGGCYGAQCVGENFARMLAALPPYVDPMSSLLGAWYIDAPDYRTGPHWPPDAEFSYDHLKADQARYNIISGIGGGQHFCPDLKIGFSLGWGGILNAIRQNKANPPDGADPGFYEGHEAVVLGIQAWMKKHVCRARQMAQSEPDPSLRDQLISAAAMNERLLEEPPRTFRDACQWISWVSVVTRMFNGAGGIGQLDELLQPFYERDMAAGITTDEEAIFHLICMFLIDTQYYQIGGPNAEGQDRTSRVSFLILDALHRMKTTSNVTVRVWEGLDETLFNRAVDYLFEDRNGSPRFIGETGMTEGFMKNGYTRAQARERVTSGCHWVAIPGREYTLNDIVKLNFAAVFDAALREMVADPTVENSISHLWNAYDRHLTRAVDCVKQGIDHHLRHMYKVKPELPLNLLCYGPVARGRDITHGGVDHYNMCIDGAGLATAADSFAAVEQRVEGENRLSWENLIRALDTDFENERIRLMLHHISRYGSGGSRADDWAVRLTQRFVYHVKKAPTPDGFNCIPGLFSWANTIGLGKAVGATPNGRHAHAPISHGANPDPGFKDAGAATALATALASVQCGYGNTVPLQLELDPGFAHQKQSAETMKTLIRTYCNNLNGTLMNINILDKQQVLEAHENPDKYPDLIVRVTGFSAYFRMLSKEFRQLVVDRILSES